MKLNIVSLPLVTKEDLDKKIMDISKTLDTVRTYHYSPFRGIGTIVSFLLFLASLDLLNASLASHIVVETTYLLLVLSFVFVPTIFAYYLWKLDAALSKYPKIFGLNPDQKENPIYFQYRRDLIGRNSGVFISAIIVFFFGLFVILAIFSNVKFPLKASTIQEYLSGDMYEGFIALITWSLIFLFVPVLFYVTTKLDDTISIRLKTLKIKQPWKLQGTRFFYPILALILYFVVAIAGTWYRYGSTIPQSLRITKNILVELLQLPAFYLSVITLIWMFGEIISQLSKILIESHLLDLYSKLQYLAEMAHHRKVTNETEFMVFYYERIEKYSKISVMNIFLFFPVWIYISSMAYIKYQEKMHNIPGITEIIRSKFTKIYNKLKNKFSK